MRPLRVYRRDPVWCLEVWNGSEYLTVQQYATYASAIADVAALLAWLER